MERAIASILIGKRARKTMGDLGGLARSINEVGLLHPVVIDTHNRLIGVCTSLPATPYLVVG